MIIIGVDPGQSGGIAYLSGSSPEPIKVIKMPETLTDLRDFLRDIKQYNHPDREIIAYLEIVHSMPRQGVASSFKFGKNYGNVEAALIFSGFRLERVTPQKWQQAMSCLSRGDKNVTKRKAQELFPSVKITHATADALLIAEYGKRKERGMISLPRKSQ